MKRLVLLATACLACSSSSESTPPISSAPVPAELAVLSGDAQTAPVGTDFAEPLVVRLTDAEGQPVPGYPVLVEAQDLGQFRDTTDPTGLAHISLRASTLAAVFTLHVHADQPAYYSTVTATADAAVLPGPPATVTFRDFPQKAVLAESLDVANLVTGATDLYGNLVPITAQGLAAVPRSTSSAVRSDLHAGQPPHEAGIFGRRSSFN